MAEPFWAIHLEFRPQVPGAHSVAFTWDRARLFDQATALLFYAPCVASPEAAITRVRGPERGVSVGVIPTVSGWFESGAPPLQWQ